MTLDEIERLLRRLARTDITSIEIIDAGTSLKLRLDPDILASVPGADRGRGATAGDDCLPATPVRVLRAPAIGRLRLRHPQSANDAEATFPRAVLAEDIVAFLEAGSFLRPVLAEEDGTIGAPLVPEGRLVGYGTPLFPFL